MTLKLAAGLTLDNGLRPQAIAGVAPTLDYRFARDKREIETVSLVDKLAFTGGDQGTFVGSDGYIQQATTNVPRFDHDPMSRVSEGLLVEESRTNLLPRSEEFDNGSWIKVNSTASANTATAPDGTETADTFIPNNTSIAGQAQILQDYNSATAGTAYSFSIYCKAAGHTAVRLQLGVRTGAGVFLGQATYVLDTAAKTFALFNTSGTPPTNISSSIEQLPNGWFRVALTGTAPATTGIIRSSLYSNELGDGTSGIYIWGAQLEAASTPSSYIPTTSTTVTRTADSATIDGTGILTGTYTIVEKPAGCAVESGGDIVLQEDYTVERVMAFPAALSAGQITAIREAM